MKLFWGFLKMKSSSVSSFMLFLYSLSLLPFSLYFFLSNKCILLEWELLSSSSASMAISFVLDLVGMSFSNVVCFISACVMLFSSSYMSGDVFLSRFTWLVMLFVLSMNLLVFIPNLVALLIGWDGLGIVSFALVIYYQNKKSLSAGMLTALANRVGDVMLLMSIGLCVLQGHWNVLFMWDTSYSPLLAFCPIISLWWFLFCAVNMAAPSSINLLSEILVFPSILFTSIWLSIPLMMMSFLAAVHSLYLYVGSQHGGFFKFISLFSGMKGALSLLFLLHYLPINLMIFKSGVLCLWSI